jgi:hypothetical protein
MTALKQQQAVLPKQQSVVVKVDKATMTAKVVEIIEQKLLPKLTQQAQQIATEAIQNAKADTHLQLTNEIDKELPALKEQLLATVTQDSLTAIQPMIEQQINASVAVNPQQATESMTANLDVSKQASNALAIQAQAWLVKQEHQVELGMQIRPKVMGAVEQHLANQQNVTDIDIHNDKKHDLMAKRIGQIEYGRYWAFSNSGVFSHRRFNLNVKVQDEY